MGNSFQMVPLSNCILPIERPEVPVAGKIYRQIGVRLWGEGAYEREPIDGSQTKYSTLSRIETDDIVVNKIWARNGSIAVAPEYLSGSYGSGEFPTFTPIREEINPRWFHWFTKTRDFWNQCDEKSRGTSGKNRIRPEKFLEILIPIPPLEEQRRIVARIEELAARIEEARGLRSQTFTETEKLLNNTLHHIFVDEENRWPRLNVGSVAEIIDPNPSHRMPHYSREGIPFISTVDFDGPETIRRNTAKYVTMETYEEQQKRCSFAPGDILYSRIGTIGQARLLKEVWPFALSHVLVTVKPKQDVIFPRFLLWYLRSDSIITQAESATRSIGVPDLGIKQIRSFYIPVPPISEQEHTVTYLDNLQSKLASLKHLQSETSSELNALLPSILDKAFKGEL